MFSLKQVDVDIQNPRLLASKLAKQYQQIVLFGSHWCFTIFGLARVLYEVNIYSKLNANVTLVVMLLKNGSQLNATRANYEHFRIKMAF